MTGAMTGLLNAGTLPNNVIKASSLAVENGGSKTAIDAYSDGAGALLINQAADTKFDNSPMNNLVFKFGDSAKENNVRLDDQVITIDALISTTAQKADAVKLSAVKLALEGTTCDDNNALTMLDHYESGVCVGTVMNCENGFFGNYKQSIFCPDGRITTPLLSTGWLNLTDTTGYLHLYNNPALTNVDNLVNLKSIGQFLALNYNGNLTNVDGLTNLTSVGLFLYLNNNPLLTNVNSLINLTSIGGDLFLQSNPLLTNVNGFINLKSVGARILIYNNPALADISGFRNLTSVANYISFDNKTYATKLPANSYICQNYATKIYFNGVDYANATTKLQVCNP